MHQKSKENKSASSDALPSREKSAGVKLVFLRAAICSSFLELPIPSGVASIGEIGLGGEYDKGNAYAQELVEDEYIKQAEEAKKREASLENDLANMWVLVAQLKKDGGSLPQVEDHVEVLPTDSKVEITECNDGAANIDGQALQTEPT